MNQENDGPVTPSEEKVHELVAEFHRLEDRGQAVSPADFVAQHPEHSDALKSYFDGVAAVDQMSDPPPAPEQTFVTGNTQAVADDQTMIEDSASIAANAKISADAPPTQFGRYKILDELGRGAMGAVYLAQDEQLDRKVALKIPQFGGALNKGLLERFYREARAAGNLRHPGICPVYDVGEIDGQHFITMAFIEGRPLRDFSKSSKRQADKQTARVIRKIAMAMAEAHDQNVIHRDLKPANIMIDTKNEPVVMDFGLARRAAENEEKLTHTGTVIGTPAYMSPEQVDGDNENVGPPADIYSLGVIFYELLTGELPFKGNLMSILKQISMKQPRPPVELHSETDPFLQDLCLKMLEKDAKDRPESMHEVAKELSEWLQGLHAPTDESGMLETSRVPGRSKKKKEDAVEATDPMTTPGIPRSEPEPEEFPKIKDPEPVSVTELSATTVTPGRPTAAADQPPAKNRKLLMAGLCGAGMLLAIVMFFIKTPYGTLRVEVFDEDIEVSVKGTGIVVRGTDTQGVEVSPGDHILHVKVGAFDFDTAETLSLKKGDDVVVKIELTEGQVQVVSRGKIIGSSEMGQSRPGSPTPAPPVSPPMPNYALEFDGLSNYVDTKLVLDVGQPYTVELTVAPRTVTGLYAIASSLCDAGERAPGFSLAQSRTGLYFSRNWNDSEPRAAAKNVFVADRVLRLAGVWDGQKLSVYVDGKRFTDQGATHYFATVSPPTSILLAAERSEKQLSWFFKGRIDEIRISRTARYSQGYTPSERLEIDEHTIALYHCDEGQGDVLKDSSGNGHHGKITGAKWVLLNGTQNQLPSSGIASGLFELEMVRTDRKHSRIDVPSLKLNGKGPITIEAFVTVGDSISEEIYAGIEGGYRIQQYYKDQLQFRWNQRGASMIRLTKKGSGKREHLAGVFTGTKFLGFRDGVLISEQDSSETPPELSDEIFRMGGCAGTHFGQVRISSTARYLTDFTPTQQLNPDENTLALYNFDEGQGDVLKDSSGNGHDGKIVGAKWVRVESNTPLTVTELLASPDYEWSKPVKLGPAVNDGHVITPFIAADGLSLYFARLINDKQSIWVSRRHSEDHRFSKPDELKLEGVDALRVFSPALSADELTLVFASNSHGNSQTEHEQVKRIWVAQRSNINEPFGIAQRIDTGIDSDESVSDTTLSADGNTLLFSSRREDGYGLNDVWMAHRTSVQGKFGRPVNLGHSVNTGKLETESCLSTDGRTLLFVRWTDKLRRIWMSTRPTIDDPFGEPVMLEAIRGDGGSADVFGPSLSADGRSLYFVNTGDDGLPDIWVSHRVRKTISTSAPVKSNAVSSGATVIASAPPPAVAPFDEAQAKAHQKAWAKHLGLPVEKKVPLAGGEEMVFVLVPPGEFMMGSTREEQDRFRNGIGDSPWAEDWLRSEGPRHRVRITRPFYLGKYEVTNAQWQSLGGKSEAGSTNNPSHPAVGVSWIDIQKRISEAQALAPPGTTFTLPTEAQWEYACRAGTTTVWHFGDDEERLKGYAWYEANSELRLQPVGKLFPNAFGLHDMLGNAIEHCSGPMHTDFYTRSPVDDPEDTEDNHSSAQRGGSQRMKPALARSATRFSVSKSAARGQGGFRLVLSINASEPPMDVTSPRPAAESKAR